MPENTMPTVVQLTVRGVVLGQETINRYFYACADASPSLGALMDLLDTNVLSPQLTIMSSAAGFQQIDALMVKGGNTFASKVLNEVGLNSGDCLPPFVSFDFTLIRGGGGERNGYKRIAGVPESEQINGTITPGAAPSAVAAADAMAADLTGGGHTWTPVIKRTRIARIHQVTPKYYTISGVAYSKIGTQNSRKFGHGR